MQESKGDAGFRFQVKRGRCEGYLFRSIGGRPIILPPRTEIVSVCCGVQEPGDFATMEELEANQTTCEQDGESTSVDCEEERLGDACNFPLGRFR